MKRAKGRYVVVALSVVLLSVQGCGGGGGGAPPPPSSQSPPPQVPTYTVGGVVSGLLGTGLVLQNNGGDDLSIVADGPFTFGAGVPNGTEYDVTVVVSPIDPAQTCAVTNGTGTIAGANVTSVTIECVTSSYRLGGTVSGLVGRGLELRTEAGDSVTIDQDGPFEFPEPLADLTEFSVDVATQPTLPRQTCTVENAAGTVRGADAADISVLCVLHVPRYAYVVNRDDTLSIFAADPESGRLTARGYVTTGLVAEHVAFHPSGRFAYVVNAGDDENRGSVAAYAVDAATGSLTEMTGSPYAAGFSPVATVFDPSGRFAFVPNNGDDTISAYSVDPADGTLTEVAGSPFLAMGEDPSAAAVGLDGRYLYVLTESGSIVTFAVDAENGALVAVGDPVPTPGNGSSILIDPTGRFLFSASLLDFGETLSAYTIDRETGELTEVAGSPYTAGDQSIGTAVDPTGRFLYVANRYSNDISAYRIDGESGALTEIEGSPFEVADRPTCVAVDPNGRFLRVASVDTLETYAIDPATGALHSPTSVAARGMPAALALSEGTEPVAFVPRFAYAATVGSDLVYGYAIDDETGALAPIAGSPFPAGGEDPEAIAADPAGRFLYVSHHSGVSAFEIDAASGALTPIAGSPFGIVDNPLATVVEPSARFVYVADGNGGVAAFAIDAASGALTPIDADPSTDGPQHFPAGTTPCTIGVDPTGRYLYVGNFTSDDVSAFVIDAATGALAPVAGSPFAAQSGVESLSIDLRGRALYTANRIASSLSAFSIEGSTGALTPVSGSPFPAEVTLIVVETVGTLE